MDYQNGHVMTLANSIIGVSILAMPYCFKQCGVLLSILILLISSIISRLACHFLLKSAIIARRKTFEFLAFHIFGALGKFAIEVGMIGFLLGTCIAFFVVMGDLGPEIIAEMTGVRTGNAMRNSILVALAVFCVLPLGLLRNVDSLNGVSKATIGFYCCLVLKIVVEALPHIFTGDWAKDVILWRPAGILQCLPIFSMALFCQTQLFEIYQALPNASLDKMNNLIRVAVNICTWVYIFVGTFGYIAFFNKPFTGNILLSFRPSIVSDVMKMGFVLSLAFSFPLVIFPCRASLFSLLYKGTSYTSVHEGVTTNYISEGKFKILTVIIVTVSLTIGILIPNIELVLGLVGSTIGVMICVLFPVTCFICISPKNTNERILAQMMLFVGVIVMVLGTYANLYAFEEVQMGIMTEKAIVKQEIINGKDNINDIIDLLNPKLAKIEEKDVVDIPKAAHEDKIEEKPKVEVKEVDLKKAEANEVRHEPPQPEEPKEVQSNKEKVQPEAPKENPVLPQPAKIKEAELEGIAEVKTAVVQQEMKEIRHEPPQPEEPIEAPASAKPHVSDDIKKENTENKEQQNTEQSKHSNDKKEPLNNQDNDKTKDIVQIKPAKVKVEEVNLNPIKDNNKTSKPERLTKKNDEVAIEAIQKEDKELKEQEKEKEKDAEYRNKILIDTLQKQNEFQKEIVEQHKKLIEVIQNQQVNANSNEINEEKLKAVKEIKNIAMKAIESISGQDNKNFVTEAKEAKKEDLNDAKPVEKKISPNPDPAPLSYQLGLNQEGKETNQNKSGPLLIPLPIVLANLNKDSGIVSVKVNKTKLTNSQEDEKNKEEVKIKQENIKNENDSDKKVDNKEKNESNDDVKAMRREILSDGSENLARVKRNTENDIVLEEAGISSVCQDIINKATSTEKPIIEKLCKLTEPDLVHVDFNTNGFQEQNGVLLKLQKKDLKK